jgi:hypothetical protein
LFNPIHARGASAALRLMSLKANDKGQLGRAARGERAMRAEHSHPSFDSPEARAEEFDDTATVAALCSTPTNPADAIYTARHGKDEG